MDNMDSADYAAVEAIFQRIHTQKHAGWCCEDMHPIVHADHVAGFRKVALAIHLGGKKVAA
jgi:hypothetical protein